MILLKSTFIYFSHFVCFSELNKQIQKLDKGSKKCLRNYKTKLQVVHQRLLLPPRQEGRVSTVPPIHHIPTVCICWAEKCSVHLDPPHSQQQQSIQELLRANTALASRTTNGSERTTRGPILCPFFAISVISPF